jgi:uncharacterized protein (DUF1015 family)
VAQLFPFRALRPAAAAAAQVAAVPYDVVNVEEARALAEGNQLSFLHVTRSEIDLPADVHPYDDAVYRRAAANLETLKHAAPLVVDPEPAVYCYRLRMGSHEQTGLCGCFSIDEYESGLIRKHETTRRDKEDDRTRHITELRAQTGLVFLTYRASADVDAIVNRVSQRPPLYDFVAADAVAHAVWKVVGADRDSLVAAFARLDALYVADGHHRAASAARARQRLADSASGELARAEMNRFVAVAFPHNQVQLLPYNRVVKDLAGQTPEAFLAALRSKLPVRDGTPTLPRAGHISMFLAGQWHSIELPHAEGTSRAEGLDVEVLQKKVLEPLLQVGDPRSDSRIDFVGGIRGTAELERLVSTGRAAVAFSMAPVSVSDLMTIADGGGIMPPKSTWFEPKLRDGLLVHLI